MISKTGDHARHQTHRILGGCWLWPCLALALAMALSTSSCQTQQTPPGGGEPRDIPDPQPDPLAQVAAIDDSGTVVPGTVELSKSAGSRVQWRNSSKDTMLVLLKDAPIGELIPPGQLSASHRVCIDCQNGFYPYFIKRMVRGQPQNAKSGPPAEPQFGVGD